MTRAYYFKNRKRLLAYQRKYRKKNPEKVKRCKHRSTKKNPEGAATRTRRWHKRHPGRGALLSRRYYKKQKEKIIDRSRRWRKKNPERYKRQYLVGYLKRKYKITLNEFEAFRLAQKNACRICNKKFDKVPQVDHSHKTGAVRGLLCLQCNAGLGMFKDLLKNLESAVKYMKETER